MHACIDASMQTTVPRICNHCMYCMYVDWSTGWPIDDIEGWIFYVCTVQYFLSGYGFDLIWWIDRIWWFLYSVSYQWSGWTPTNWSPSWIESILYQVIGPLRYTRRKKKKKKKTNQCIYSNLTTPDLIRFFPSRSLRNKHAVNKRIPQKSMDKQVDRKMVGMYKCMHLPMYNQLLHYIL